MSVRTLSAVWSYSTQKGGHLLVMLALSDFADDDGLSWASVPTIAAKSRLTDRHVQRVLRDLEAAGEIAIGQRSRGDGSATSNTYRVILAPPGVKMSPPPVSLSGGGDAGVTRGGGVDVTRVVTPASPQEPSENRQIEPSPLCAELALPASALPAGEVVMVFPVVGKTREWPLLKSKVAEYQIAFPAMDVAAQMPKARQWAIDNPGKRKTAGGMPKFLFGWLERAQNRGAAGAQQRAPEQQRRGLTEPENWRELIRIHHADNPPLLDEANGNRSWESIARHSQESIVQAIRSIPFNERRSA
jgi:hypothetical protein